MGASFSSEELGGFASNKLPSTSYAYATGNTAFLGGDVTYSYDGFIFLAPVGQVTPFLIQPAAAAPTLTCSPITVNAVDQSLECPIAGTSLTDGLYTLSFSQYTSTEVTDSAGNTYYTLEPTSTPYSTDTYGKTYYSTFSNPDNTLTSYDDGYTYSFIAPIATLTTSSTSTVTDTITPVLTAYATATSGVDEVSPTSTIDVPAESITVTLYSTTIIAHTTTHTTLTGVTTTVTKTGACPASTLLKCNQDNCYRAMSNRITSASAFCAGYTTTTGAPTPSYLSQCSGLASRVSSACTCLFSPTVKASAKAVPARGIEQVVYGPPNFTYSDEYATATITATAGAPTTITDAFEPSKTITDPNRTVSSGTATVTTHNKSKTTTTSTIISTVDHRSATTTTVLPSNCNLLKKLEAEA